uniref:Uncharacterized protein n=1 Tax=Dictyoglomus turgidum TaxID=513050 RepID=A0A7C3WM12_9BACT
MKQSDKIETMLPEKVKGDYPSRNNWDITIALIAAIAASKRDFPLFLTKRLAERIKKVALSIQQELSNIDSMLDSLPLKKLGLSQSKINALKTEISQIPDSIRPLTLTSINPVLNELKQNITAYSNKEARERISESIESLINLYTVLIQYIEYLSDATQDYSSVVFPTSLLSYVKNKSLTMLEKDVDTDSARQWIEKLIDLKVTIDTITKVKKPVELIMTGTGSATDGIQEGIPASITGNLSEPYENEDSTLDLLIDGTEYLCSLSTAQGATLLTTSPTNYGGSIGYAWLICQNTGTPPTTLTLKYYLNDNPTFSSFTADLTVSSDWIYLRNTDLCDAWNTQTGLHASLYYQLVKVITTKVGESASLKVFDYETDHPLPQGSISPLVTLGYQNNKVIGKWTWIKDHKKTINNNCPAKVSVNNLYTISGTYGKIYNSNTFSVSKLEGTITITRGSNIGIIPDFNLLEFGIQKGDKILISGTSNYLYTITKVTSQTVTFNENATEKGDFSFIIFPDTSVIRQGDLLETPYFNRKITSVSNNLITIDGYFPLELPNLASMPFSIRHNGIILSSPQKSKESAISAVTAPSELGLPTQEARGSVFGFTGASFQNYQIEKGDLLIINGNTYKIKENGVNLELIDPITNNTTGTFVIKNGNYVEWENLVNSVKSYDSQGLANLIDSLKRMLKVIQIKQAVLTGFHSSINIAIQNLATLIDCIDNYKITMDPDITRILMALKDMKAERAVELFETCQFKSAFALKSDEITYSSYFAKKVRDFMGEIQSSRFDLVQIDLLNYYNRKR